MVGLKTEKSYISKFGMEEGKRRYDVLVARRKQRVVRKSIVVSDDLEKEIKSGNAVKCEACGKITTTLQWTHFKYNCSVKTIDEYKRLYPTAPLKCDSLIKELGVTLDGMILRYGIDDGTERFNSYREKQAVSNTFEYKKEKHGWSKEEFDAFNLSRAVTLDNLIARHGEIEGKVVWNIYCEKQSYTNTLEYYVEKYGEVDGIVEWEKYNHMKGSSGRVPDIMARYGVSQVEAEGILADRRKNALYSSNAEKIFVDKLETLLGYEIQYTHKSKQFCMWSLEAHQPFFYDVCCSFRKKIIEFNGTFWHADPLIYENDDIMYHGKTAENIRETDRIKMATAVNRGFQVMVVWENEINDAKFTEIKEWWNS